MLTSIPVAPSQSQVVLSAQSFSTSAVIYTVPTGRTFRGHIYCQQGSPSSIVINGTNFACSSTAQTTPTILPITLVAGTVVRNASTNNNYVLVGVVE